MRLSRETEDLTASSHPAKLSKEIIRELVNQETCQTWLAWLVLERALQINSVKRYGIENHTSTPYVEKQPSTDS